MSEKKHREWWVDRTPCDEETQNVFDAFSEHPRQGPLLWQSNLVHVIEISAITSLQNELNELRRERDSCRTDRDFLDECNVKLNQERDALKREVERLKSSLLDLGEDVSKSRYELAKAKTDHERWCPHFHVAYQDMKAEVERLQSEDNVARSVRLRDTLKILRNQNASLVRECEVLREGLMYIRNASRFTTALTLRSLALDDLKKADAIRSARPGDDRGEGT